MEQKDFDAVSHQMVDCWHEIEKLSGLTLTLHDHSGMIKFEDRINLLPGINYHRSECCRFRPFNGHRCVAHCALLARERAAKEKKAFVMTCWRGIKELVMPLYIENKHAGTIFAGAFRDENFHIQHLPGAYRQLYERLPLWDDARMSELESIMLTAGSAMFQLAENFHSSSEYCPERKKVIKDFFHYRFHEKIGASDLAASLGLSESRTLHLLHELFGRGFSQLLNEERVAQVENYLEQTTLSLREIACLTGFQNEYYLSAVFRKYKKISPGALRKQRKN